MNCPFNGCDRAVVARGYCKNHAYDLRTFDVEALYDALEEARALVWAVRGHQRGTNELTAQDEAVANMRLRMAQRDAEEEVERLREEERYMEWKRNSV